MVIPMVIKTVIIIESQDDKNDNDDDNSDNNDQIMNARNTLHICGEGF